MQKFHKKYFHEDISLELAYDNLMYPVVADMVGKLKIAVLLEDEVWLENLGKFNEEMEELEKVKYKTEDGQLLLFSS